VAVKVAKDKHDLRFDIPCLGAATLETCREAKIAVLAFESGRTLLLEREQMATLAKKSKISVVAC
jgi:UDP-2,3-diacylglucosamine hydrolase